MEPRIFHGELTPNEIAEAIVARFSHGNLRAQRIGSSDESIVQIATSERPVSGGQTALTVSLRKVTDGVSVRMGKQNWLGIAASLGMTALAAWQNPFRLIERLDDLAQDIEYLQLSESVWEEIENVARSAGASFELSERLKRTVCPYCQTANPVGEPACVACGAPLGLVQPRTCLKCGFIVRTEETRCPNCSAPL